MPHSGLGAVEESSQTGFNISTDNGLTTTVIIRATTFAQGEGEETFTFFGSGEGMALAGWEVNSEDMRDNINAAQADAQASSKPELEEKPAPDL
jgi:hypothetical protein